MRCSKCQLMKSEEEFHVKSTWCKSCVKAYSKGRYARRALELTEAHKAHNRNSRQERLVRLYTYLLEHPCVDCGEGNPIVLEFDHVRGEKLSDVSSLVHRFKSWSKVEEEITKCDVRCANCHRLKTWRNSYAGVALQLAKQAHVFQPAEIIG